jgi:hypothetical protein
MKKVLQIGLLLALSFTGYAQKIDTVKSSIQKNAEAIGHGGNNELKINLLYTVLGIPEVSYERLLADNMGLGASILLGLDNSTGYKFAFIPHYRVYFGAKKANGFFIEGNTGIFSLDDYDNVYFGPTRPRYVKSYFGLGAAAGAKFLTRNGFLGEAYFGAGRLFGNEDNFSAGAYPRIGITIGKRF